MTLRKIFNSLGLYHQSVGRRYEPFVKVKKGGN